MNSPLNALLSVLTSGISSGAILWLGRTWISERLRQSIANEYAQKLERHKAELAAANAVDLERVKASYAQERAIRSLGEDSFREAMRVSHTKRIEAVQVVWDGVMTISRNAPPALTAVDIVTEKELDSLLDKAGARSALDQLSVEFIQERTLFPDCTITSARLLAGPYLYSLFFVYRAIVGRASWLLLEGLQRNKAVAWYRDKAMVNLLGTVLSDDEKKAFASLPLMWSTWVRECIERKFMEASAVIVKGEELARELVQQANVIEAAVAHMLAKGSVGKS